MKIRSLRRQYDLELAGKTLLTGRIYAGILVVLTAHFTLIDQAEFGMFDTWSWRLLGISGLMVFIAGTFTFLKSRPFLANKFYAAALACQMAMFCGLGYLVFTKYYTPFHQTAYLISFSLFMFILSWISLGAKRYIPWIIFGALLLLNIILVTSGHLDGIWAYLTALNTLGIFVIPFSYIQEKNEFELYTTMHQLKEKEQVLSRQKRELEILNQDLESFNYSISHDLKTPLRIIHSFTQLLIKKVSKTQDEDIIVYSSYITGGLEKMNKLIDGLLSLSRIGKKELQKEQVDIEEIFRSTFRDLQLQQDVFRRNIEIEMDELPEVFGDTVLLTQAIQNLLANAIKYTSERTWAAIEVGYEERDGFQVFSIKDNGVGFDQQYADQLFTPFKRLHSPKEFEGNGLGLTIVERIIHYHGGEIWAQGEPEAGAIFYFSLPKRKGPYKLNKKTPMLKTA